MARFPEYTAPNLDIRPTETGIDANTQAARRIGAFYSQAGEDVAGEGRQIGSAIQVASNQAYKWEENREVTAGAKNWATFMSGQTDKWNQIVANVKDPNDPSIKQKFLEQLEPELDKFGNQGFLTEGGKDWARQHIDQFRQHMVTKTSADMMHLAGQAAESNTKETFNQLSNMVYKDSRDLDTAMDTVRGSVNGIVRTSPNLGENAGVVRIKLTEDGLRKLVKSAALGDIDRTGQMPKWVDDPKYSKYLDGPELHQFQKQAQAAANHNRLVQKQLEDYARQQDNLVARRDIVKNTTDNMVRDPATNLPIISPDLIDNAKKIAQAHPESREALEAYEGAFRLAQHYQNITREEAERVVTNPTVHKNLYDGLLAGTTTALDIDKAEANPDPKQRIKASDAAPLKAIYDQLQKEPLKGDIWTDFKNAAHAATIVQIQGVPGRDVKGEANYANAMREFIPAYLHARAQPGGAPANALDLTDPKSMASQYFEKYTKRTLQDRMHDYLEIVGGEAGAVEATGGAPPLAERQVGVTKVTTSLGTFTWTRRPDGSVGWESARKEKK